jgi:hypothetical protein
LERDKKWLAILQSKLGKPGTKADKEIVAKIKRHRAAMAKRLGRQLDGQ